jgi:hypothetical protein
MDIQKIIKLLRQYTDEHKREIDEQDEGGTTSPAPSTPPASSGGGSSASPSGGSQKYPAVTKWESGVARGPANQIGNTKWSDIVKLNRGKANPIDQKSKWSSGVTRGKGNTLI